MSNSQCRTCHASAAGFVDDVVTGDTICTSCGTVCDVSAGLLIDPHHMFHDRTGYHGRNANRTDVCDDVWPESVLSPISTVSDYGNNPDSRYGDLLKRLSQLTPDIDRRSRIVMQRACGRAVDKHPELGFKRPESVVLAVFILQVYSDKEGYNRPRTLAHDPTIKAMCALLNVKPSSVASVLRILEK